MREMPQSFGFRRPRGVVLATLAILVAAFVITAPAAKYAAWGPDLYQALWLDPAMVLRGRVWTLLSYALLHDLSSPQHLFYNCLGIYFFAPDLEEIWGSRRLVIFMLLAALGGGLFVMATALIGLGAAPVVGASAIAVGLLVAWGLTFPDRQILLFFFVPMRGIHIVYATLAFEVLNALSLSGVSAAAHFGGMAAGALYASLRGGRLRRLVLEMRLKRLQAENAALYGVKGKGRAAGSLRVIQGGGDKTPPKDKRYLN